MIMADQFLGEIRMFGGNFAPANWAACDGQLVAIQQHTALFSLLGTNFGGNGQSTFGLPNLQGNAPLSYGNGAGLSQYSIGETAGLSAITLTAAQSPPHTHSVMGTSTGGGVATPSPSALFGQTGGRGS